MLIRPNRKIGMFEVFSFPRTFALGINTNPNRATGDFGAHGGVVSCGDPNTAQKCVDGMMGIRREPNQVWVDGYDSVSGEEVLKTCPPTNPTFILPQ